MGTNYYLTTEPCPTCGRRGDKRHIGKSSYGWCFALHIEPPEIISLEDWQREWSKPGAEVLDEYGDRVEPEKLLGVITNRARHASSTGYILVADDVAEPGPNGLAQHRINSKTRCVGHGPGTWDLIEGEFA